MNFYTLFNSVRLKRGKLLKAILVMKLIALLTTVVCLHVAAAGYAQKITLNEKNASMETIFKDIRKQSGYIIFFDKSLLNNLTPVNIKVTNATLKETLVKCLEDQPLTFTIVDNTIIIKQKESSFFENIKDKTAKLLALPADVVGKVIDTVGQPLAGATVRLKNTNYSALTDARGDFSFPSVPQGKYTLVVTYLGYEDLERKIAVEGKTLNLPLVLHAALAHLEQVQVIAYGTESKRFSVGSVATVTADQISKQPVTNPLLALQGQAPGLAITAMNGVPGSSTLVQVRGQSSLGLNSNQIRPYDQPLFIIDGVPSATQNANISQLSNLAVAQYFTGGINQSTGISAFNDINPNDIESITILKDADATAIYGSQGANGVILITTKRGKAGTTTFDVNVNSQFNAVARPVQLLNTQQYLQLRKDAFTADGLTPSSDPNSSSYAPDLTIYDQNKYTNWQKIIQGNSTNNTDVHASVSGGTANNTFIVSGGYTRSNYNYPGDFSDQRYTLHSALHNVSTNKRFTLDLVTDYGYDQNTSAAFGGSQYVTLAPNTPDLINGAGNLIWGYKSVPINQNFYATLKQPDNLSSFNFNSALNLNYQILKGLTIGSSLGYSRTTANEHSINPSTAQNPSFVYISAGFANNSAQTINIEPQINYNKAFSKGELTALVGATYRKNTTYSYNDGAYGYANDNFLGSINGASSNFATENTGINKYIAAFGRLKYVYDQKYIIQLSGRRDGSSNFGPGRQFGTFGSVGAGWIFSEEKAFKDALPFVSYGKLSGSYGTTGSDASAGYKYQATYKNVSIPAFQGIKQSYPVNLYNPEFQWAAKKELNLAADLGFFNNRLLLNATYYRSREGDELVNYPLPIQAGFAAVYGNLNATVQNQGWEFTATSTNIKTNNFNWTTNFNLSFNRNKLLDFPNLASSSFATVYVVGQPTSVIYGYRYKDVNPTTGLFEYYAANGTVTSTPNSKVASLGGDKVPIGNREINYMGGFGNTFSYKHFSLYVFCQFSSGLQPNFLSSIYSSNSSYPPGSQANLPAYVLGKYWTAAGQNALLQRLGTGFSSASYTSGSDFSQSSGALGNDTYLRVKTAALSYSLPDAFIRKINIKGGSIFVNAQNLFTITNYKVGDPEQPDDFTAFPLQRIVALGLNLKF
ncbi:MAG: TonB-dependent receptor plug [Mucilaginibacter sp.]|nr:TonB-dependent receptor plug [Mucilaginibacter sp.]